jgi:hypothetical protein
MRIGAEDVDITEATLADGAAAFSAGGFVHVFDGIYRVDAPDAAFASGAKSVIVGGTLTGKTVIPCVVDLVAYDPFDAAALGLSTLTGHVPQTGDSFARIGATGSGLTTITSSIAALNNLSSAGAQAAAEAALVAMHLDHLLATDYDPASKPGVATALLNELIGSDSGVSRFTANALELAPGADAADGFPTGFAQTGSNATTLVLQAEHNSTDVDMTGYGVMLTYDSDPNIIALGVVTAHNQGTATLTIEKNGGGALDRALDTDVEYVIAPAAFTYLLQIKAMLVAIEASVGAPVTLESGQLDDVAPEVVIDALEARATLNTYQAVVQLIEDADDDSDVWTVDWYKNSALVTSGVTSPLISVRAIVAGTTLIAETAMTEAADEAFHYVASDDERVTDGVAYRVTVKATIDGAVRTMRKGVRG